MSLPHVFGTIMNALSGIVVYEGMILFYNTVFRKRIKPEPTIMEQIEAIADQAWFEYDLMRDGFGYVMKKD